ncbi:hypothetical protein ONS95_004321 [Cadophora gregata]|uniref:uncharacterized protein n=1 Tax=Cadophora gregata TaxID=51156 RepID=UPI0026DDAA26|nr:uncharacterized protein ONS95_004321 [Cadophora gregata]KAK0105295.1 hypothetical protein ONS96_004691 [Cadophora gregata f. sp. sojae]KAK0105804.1 hypothetical protein ONS95_004321 [Cadophora gregata]
MCEELSPRNLVLKIGWLSFLWLVDRCVLSEVDVNVKQILFTMTAVFALQGISNSMGMHLIDIMTVSPQNLTPAMMYWFSTELAYVLTTCILKMSIAVFLLRIAVKKSHRIILYVTTAGVIIFSIGYFLFLVFQCSPVDYFWNQFSLKPGSCLSPELVGAMTYAHSGLNALADIILAALPVVIVSQLQMNPRTKLTVSIILSMGIVACIAVVIRIPYIKILVDNADDFLFSSTDVVIWSAIEPGLAITAANLATLRPLFSACLSRKKLWGTTTAHGTYGHSKNISAFSSRKGYVRSGSRGNIEDMNLSNLSKSGHEVTIEALNGTHGSGHTRSKLESRISEERLQKAPSWDIERQSQGPLEEWPGSPQEIRKTVRTEVYSEVHPPLPTSQQELFQSQLGPKTDGRRDVWPEIGIALSQSRRKSHQSLKGPTAHHWI